MASMDVYLLTFNCARTLIQPAGIASSLLNALQSDGPLPDIVVLSLQEIAPIAHSFLGGSYLTPYLNRFVTAIELAARQHRGGAGQAYRNVATRTVGMTGLMVFATPNVADGFSWIESAGVGLGVWEMGNKGAVGVRIGLQTTTENESTAITFIAAHLAPDEHAVARRNEDWKAIVSNLVFTEDQQASKPLKKRRDADSRTEGDDSAPLLSGSTDQTTAENNQSILYQTSGPVFLAGDLNYRTRDASPDDLAHLTYPQPTKSESSPNHFSHLLKDDQLLLELQAGRTLHGFSEFPVTFAPTYKYSHKQSKSQSPGTVTAVHSSGGGHSEDEDQWHWAKHRYPSWCDRILFFPHNNTSSHVKPHTYTSLPLPPTSDHRPVALSLSVLLKPRRDSHDFQTNPPFPLNPSWRARRSAARWKEIVIGLLAYHALTKEGNVISAAVVVGLLAGWLFFTVALR